MFSKVEARYALRSFLVGVAAATPLWIADQTWRMIVGSGVIAALSYAGIGAAVPAVEPSIGRKP